jgi:hypothetical protein
VPDPGTGALVMLPAGPVALEDGFGGELSLVDGEGDPLPLAEVLGDADVVGLIVPIGDDDDGDADLADLPFLQLVDGDAYGAIPTGL